MNAANVILTSALIGMIIGLCISGYYVKKNEYPFGKVPKLLFILLGGLGGIVGGPLLTFVFCWIFM